MGDFEENQAFLMQHSSEILGTPFPAMPGHECQIAVLHDGHEYINYNLRTVNRNTEGPRTLGTSRNFVQVLGYILFTFLLKEKNNNIFGERQMVHLLGFQYM